MNIESVLFILVAGAAFTIAGRRLLILYRLMMASQGKAPAFGDMGARTLNAILTVFGQTAVLKKKWIGAIHAIIFWGFMIITLGTLEQFATTLYEPLHFEFIGESAYSALVFVQDIFTLLVLLAVFAAAYRRFIVRPKHLAQSKDATIILMLTGLLMVSILLMNGFTFIGKEVWFASAMPISHFISGMLSALGFDAETNIILGKAFKWVHMLIVLGFGIYIPGSKHLHVLAAGPNTFLKDRKREKPMRTINFEDETLTQYGAAKVTDLSWKDTLDYYSCTECGRCQELCPAWNTDKPLSPMKIIHDLKENLYRNKTAALAKKYDDVTHIVDEKFNEDVLWACTSCRACEIACPVFIGHTDKIYDARRNLVMMESRFPAEVQPVFKNLETNATPWAFSSNEREAWADGLDVKKARDGADFDVLVWVGCAASFDERNKKVMKAFVNILNKANVNFAILGNEEQCTGDPARRIGNEYLFQTLAKSNVETLNRYKVQKIVASCPHCFNTLKNEYPDFDGKFEVIHHSKFIAQLIMEEKIKPSIALNEDVTFHDSCYLGRWNGEYEGSRSALNSIPGIKTVEMKSNRDKSMCCGAGGGRMFMEETIGTRINITRTEQALETGAKTVASACPFCITMMTDGVKSKEMQGQVQVKDVAELVSESLN